MAEGVRGSGLDLTCPVCYDTYTAPRFLPCHHTLCTECISDLLDRVTDLDHFLCPLCQVKVKVPEEGVTSFQVNFYLAPLLSGRTRTTSGPTCHQCSKADVKSSSFSSSNSSSSSSFSSAAAAECQQCRVHLCKACMEEHLQVPANAKHTFAPLPSQQAAIGHHGNRDQFSSSRSSSFDWSCEGHCPAGQEMTHFCKTCCSLACGTSGCPQHQGHALVDAASEASRQRSEVRCQLLSLTTLQGALADLEDDGKARARALDESCQDAARQMEETRQRACDAISARASKAADKVCSLKTRISKVVEGEMRNIQEKRCHLSTLLRSVNDALAGSDSQFLRQKSKLMSRVQSAMSKIPPSRGEIRFSFKPDPETETFLRKEKALGQVTVKFQSPVLRHKMTLSSTKQQRKLTKLLPGGEGTMLAAVGNCLVSVSGDFQETKRLEFPGEVVDFLPGEGGKVFVVLPFPNAVKSLDLSTDVAADFITPMNPPRALALTNKQELVFASNEGTELSLTFYSLGGSRLRRVTLPKPDFSPLSVAATKGGHLFLCSSSEVVCLDADHSELASLADSSTLRPRCVSALRGMGSGVGAVLVSNWAAGNVEVFEISGQEVKRQAGLIQWQRGTSQEAADLGKGPVDNISCAVLDRAGKLWVGQEDGQIYIYDWLLRAS